MWTDGSKLDQKATAAICWKKISLNLWKKKYIYLVKSKKILNAGLWAIVTILDVAFSETLNIKDKLITIFRTHKEYIK